MTLGVGLPRRWFWTALAGLWLCAVLSGLAWLAGYDNAPGRAAAAPVRWPAASALARQPAGPTLVMLAHPRCDCTKASVGELAELMARTSHRPKAYVVFIKPGTVPGGWEHTDLWRSAEAIPGVTVLRDDDGIESGRFGAATSGQVMLYDAGGVLIFSGGITGSRGHAGDNAGRAAVLALLNSQDPRRSASPVFGCPLFSVDADRPSAELTSHDSHRQ